MIRAVKFPDSVYMFCNLDMILCTVECHCIRIIPYPSEKIQ